MTTSIFITDFAIKVNLSEKQIEYLMSHVNHKCRNIHELISEDVAKYYAKVVAHKVAVFKNGVFLNGCDQHRKLLIIHDLSKFSKEEEAYAYYNFGGENSEDAQLAFDLAWHHHKMNNPHHPEHWFDVKKDGSTMALPMPIIYIHEMVADWLGAAETYKKEGETARQNMRRFLMKRLHKFVFHEKTVSKLKSTLFQLGYPSDIIMGNGFARLKY